MKSPERKTSKVSKSYFYVYNWEIHIIKHITPVDNGSFYTHDTCT